jgi:hypothetical protein
MATANIHGEAVNANQDSVESRISGPRVKISNAGSSLLAAIAASLLIAWSVWNDRPARSVMPVEQPVVQTQHSYAPALGNLDQPIQLKQHGAFGLPVENDRAQK